jgi:isoleucyl-tRNA synthetase
VLANNDGVVLLDIDLTSELRAEGHARDVVRLLQNFRRELGLRVTDRIVVAVTAPGDIAEAVSTHQDLIGEQVLAVALSVAEAEGSPTSPGEGWLAGALPDGRTVWLQICPVTPSAP